MKTTTPSLNKNESGFASIVVALVLILVLGLLSLGFAQLSRREQQTALNKQLANQAYYAAETGVNDVVKGIQNGILGLPGGITASSPTACMTPAQLGGVNPIINPSSDVAYTCVLLNLTPPQLNYGLADGQARAMTFTPTGAVTGPINVTIQWSSSSTPAHKSFPADTSGGFPQYTQWHQGGNPNNAYPAVLQFSISPMADMSRNGLTSNMFTTFLYPTLSGGASAAYATGATSQGSITAASCSNTTYVCSATITGIPYSAGESYIVNLLDFYDNSNVTVSGNSGSGSFNFANSQDEIDVTGKAHNVLKRIHVYVTPVGSGNSSDVDSGNALQAQNICKRQQTYPGVTNYVLPTGGLAVPGDPCNMD